MFFVACILAGMGAVFFAGCKSKAVISGDKFAEPDVYVVGYETIKTLAETREGISYDTGNDIVYYIRYKDSA